MTIFIEMKFVAEYIWIDGMNNLRSKSRTINVAYSEEDRQKGRDIMKELLTVKLYEDWNYDGSSTGQAEGSHSEVILKPVSVSLDPSRKAPNVLVLCETYYPDGSLPKTNTRVSAKEIFDQYSDSEPWYGLEQEFFIMKPTDDGSISTRPIGVDIVVAQPQGQYYCSVGGQNTFGRKIAEQGYHLALEAGLTCSGMNSEVAPGQWEIQIGPCVGIDAADQLMFLRYILNRVSEIHNVQINYDPKPITGDWNGTGCHINFSTKQMREEGGYALILEAIEKLKEKHSEHMEVYGEGNESRMTGIHETADYHHFSSGVGDRGASVRIPRETESGGKGYFEDRRPAGNMDQYLATSKIMETVSQ